MSWLQRTGIVVVVAGIWLDVASCDGPSSAGLLTVASCDGHCNIEASDYNQSCSVDSDCVGTAGRFPVQFGNYCQEECICGGDAINKTSVAQYVHDVSMTALAKKLVACFCPFEPGPCCTDNRCTTTSCGLFTDAGDGGETPAVDAGLLEFDSSVAPPGQPPGSFMCGLNVGRFDAGTDAGGPWRWCDPSESCVPFNGGWACCDVPSGGVTAGPTYCAVPVSDDGGP
jgi:hypothetical protein